MVQAGFFELALNAFLKVQLESFHVKEPYLGHDTYLRIDYALKQCYNDAQAHTFVPKNETTCADEVS